MFFLILLALASSALGAQLQITLQPYYEENCDEDSVQEVVYSQSYDLSLYWNLAPRCAEFDDTYKDVKSFLPSFTLQGEGNETMRCEIGTFEMPGCIGEASYVDHMFRKSGRCFSSDVPLRSVRIFCTDPKEKEEAYETRSYIPYGILHPRATDIQNGGEEVQTATPTPPAMQETKTTEVPVPSPTETSKRKLWFNDWCLLGTICLGPKAKRDAPAATSSPTHIVRDEGRAGPEGLGVQTVGDNVGAIPITVWETITTTTTAKTPKYAPITNYEDGFSTTTTKTTKKADATQKEKATPIRFFA